jgi:DNA-binding CsgD family transcriptional regulator
MPRGAAQRTWGAVVGALERLEPVAEVQGASPHLSKELSKFLTARPSTSQICSFLVLNVPWPSRPRGAVLGVCQDEGYLQVTGSFGFARDMVAAYARQSLFDSTPLTDAVTSGEPVCVSDEPELAQRYEELHSDLENRLQATRIGALVAVPLNSHSGPIGACGMAFDLVPGTEAAVIQMMTEFSPMLSLYVDLNKRPVPAKSEEPIDWQVTPRAQESGDGTGNGLLTKRQMRVLQMLANRMSNAQIASALDYSVATIRLDTTAIFRTLGVTGRREAVEEARTRGLLLDT